MIDYSRILFVTDADTSTGPLAAAILRHYLPLEQAEIDSRGTAVMFEEPMNPKTVAIAASRGISITHTSMQLQESDFGKDVLILVPNEARKETIYEEYKEAVNVYTMTEFVNAAGSFLNPDGGEMADYGKLYDAMDEVLSKVSYKLKGMNF